MGRLIRCITDDGCVIAMAVDTTDVVNQAVAYHGTSAVVSAALGRLLTAASMMGYSGLKTGRLYRSVKGPVGLSLTATPILKFSSSLVGFSL